MGTLKHKEIDVSTEGSAALAEADRIIESLGIGDMDGLPEDPAALVARLESEPDQPTGEEGKDTTAQDDKATQQQQQAQEGSSPSTTPQDDKTATQAGDGNKAETPGEQQPAGVLLKDGKHFLPYDKHVEERRLRVAAEQRAKELEAQLAAAKAGKPAAGTEAGEGEQQQPASTGTLDGDLALVDELEAKAKAYEDEGLTEMASTTRASAKVMRAMANQLQQLGGYVKQAQEREAHEQARTRQTVQEQIAEAVDNNPKLRFLQDTMEKEPANAELWDMIADQDTVLRGNPKFASLSFSDRFARAVAMVEAVQGPIKLPPEYQTVADVKAAAAAAASNAGEFRPNTLSDLPGGGTPRGGGENPLGELDPSQLERIMMEASPDKLADILARA
jgi:hypothetical protein